MTNQHLIKYCQGSKSWRMLSTFIYLFISGVLGGFIAGLVGIGGGVVYVFIIPVALKLMGVPEMEQPQYTIANSFFAIFFASGIANYYLYKAKEFLFREVLLVGIPSIIISYFSIEYIVNTEWYSLTLFNIILMVLLTYMLYTTLLSAKKVFYTPLETLKRWKLGLTGASGGFIASLSGMGGGIVIIPILNSVMKVDIKKASAISSGVIMITSFAITIHNLLENPVHDIHNHNIGYIVFPISVSLCLGVILGSPMGVKMARKLSPSSISYIYAAFLSIVILRKIIELMKIII